MAACFITGRYKNRKFGVKAGDVLHLSTTLQQHSEDQPENIDIEVVYEDDDVLVINKPVGMVVHPGAGNQTGTLVECASLSLSAAAPLAAGWIGTPH